MIPLPLQSKIIEKKENSAVFEIEGLYPGYGVTIGNSLRRVLLSSLPGAAVTQVKIKGVQHEFSTIPGVMEDVVSILLNIKQLRFKLFSDEPQHAKLSVKGVKVVKASSFEVPTQAQLMNSDSLVATLTQKTSSLDIDILIEKGMGYQPVEARKSGKAEIGTIAIDAIYTPVRKVSYRVENMRVGERTDFDKLVLELETDGTLTPEEAFSQAAGTLVGHFALLQETFKQPEKTAPEPAVADKKKSTKKVKKHAETKKGKKTR